MRAGDFLDAAEELPLARLDDLLGGGGAVIIAPHPDDETLGCGALIAAAVADNRPVRVAIVSDGTGSHPNSRIFPRERLRALRESEAREAAGALGLDPAHVHCLGLRDRFVPANGVEAEVAATRIVALVREAQAGTMFVTWRHDPHGDHRAAYAIARAAQRARRELRLLEYAIWGRSLPPATEVPESCHGWRFDATAWRSRKQAAIACHRSQVTDLIDDDPEGFRLPTAMLARFEGSEIFLEGDP